MNNLVYTGIRVYDKFYVIISLIGIIRMSLLIKFMIFVKKQR
jgi:hypothetical protein